MSDRALALASAALAVLLADCGGGGPASLAVPGEGAPLKSAASIRAERRLYDGAPPIIPHADPGARCIQCHDRIGIEVAGLGFAPPSPHDNTRGMSAISRCVQCHVYAETSETFVANTFSGLRQDLRRGPRLYDGAPPTIPHETFMRENCAACHDGRSAREEIRTSHPERIRCRQCHVPVVTLDTFPAKLAS